MNNPLSALIDLLRIPSISTQPEFTSDMAHARDFLVHLFSSLGFDTRILPGQIHPAVFASRIVNPDFPTVLVYGHYDVQPPGAPSHWTTPAFSPDIRKNQIFARGATDNKGQFMIHVMAVAQLLERGELPVNFKFVIEGEEEIGSPSVTELATKYQDLLAADYLVVSDTEMPAVGHPAIDISLRGCLDIEIQVQTGSHDLHSGQFGGVAPNPAFILVNLLSRLKNGAGRVLIPGFYDTVTPLSAEELEDFRHLDVTAKQLTQEGNFYFVGGGEKRFSLNRRRWAEPTLDITGLDSGYTGQGTKTIIPRQASAKLSLRSVPGQNPQAIYSSLISYLQQLAPKHAVLRFISYPSCAPYKAPTSHPVYDLAKAVLKDTFGHPAVFQGQGGSIGFIPVLAESLNIPALLIGFGLPDENLHAPNEHLSLDNYYQGIAAMTDFYSRLPSLTAKAYHPAADFSPASASA